MPEAVVKLQILLRHECRDANSVKEVSRLLADLNVQTTVAGLASISAESAPANVERVFGVKPAVVAPQPPGPGDFGHSGGYTAPVLPIPPSLDKFVQSITVAPPHLTLSG